MPFPAAAQDLECKKCGAVKRRELERRCPRCAADFTLRQPAPSVQTFASIAEHFSMPLLAETAEFLSRS